MSDSDTEELRREIDALNARLDAMSTKMDALKTVLIGDRILATNEEVEHGASVWDQVTDLADQLEAVEQTAAVAAATNKDKRADGGQASKIGAAKTIARDEVVRRALDTSDDAAESTLSATKVQELGHPQHDLKYQTVKDAFSDLITSWPELLVKKDPRRLCVKRNKLSRECVLAVEESLGRTDLTKRLISEKTEGGV